MEKNLYAQVVLDLVSDAIDKPFSYYIPPRLRDLVEPGMRVAVPFRSSQLTAYVVGISEESPVEETREILRVLDSKPLLQAEFVHLSSFISRRFLTRWIEASKLCLPPGSVKEGPRYKEYIFAQKEENLLREEAERIKRSAIRQSLILEYMLQAGPSGIAWEELRKKTSAPRSSLNALVKKGYIEVKKVSLGREQQDKFSAETPAGTEYNPWELSFTQQQNAAWEKIKMGFSNPPEYFLLHGITGSGKTELYFRAAEEALTMGRSVLILVPEIALTPQVISQFRGRFLDKFALLHSSLSPGERHDNWWRIKEGTAEVVLGARSAVFAPLEDIGVIIMDEEHENTYKQNDAPRYHTRDVAKWRAYYHGAVFIMGTATPSLETYYEVQKRKVKLIELTERIKGRALPDVDLVDMRKEFRSGNRSMFSTALYKAIRDTLSRNEQLILFINRRGFAGFQLCRECGNVIKCPSCEVSLTYHLVPEHLKCHYCGYRSPLYLNCPSCNSRYIRNFGLGTQKVEREVRELFPGAEVVRMDSDVITGRGFHETIWRAFKEKKASILIGTQMVAKGLDFPGVTLVGVISADVALNLPDFRSGERTFQLLVQVSGRAGRGENQGRVIIQSYNPQNYSIKAAVSQDYKSFITEEYHRREMLNYPPFSQLILFRCSSPEDEKARREIENLKQRLKEVLPGEPGEFLGPAPAPLLKIKGHYRYHLLLKGENLESYVLRIKETVQKFRIELKEEVRVIVDFNPQMML